MHFFSIFLKLDFHAIDIVYKTWNPKNHGQRGYPKERFMKPP